MSIYLLGKGGGGGGVTIPLILDAPAPANPVLELGVTGAATQSLICHADGSTHWLDPANAGAQQVQLVQDINGNGDGGLGVYADGPAALGNETFFEVYGGDQKPDGTGTGGGGVFIDAAGGAAASGGFVEIFAGGGAVAGQGQSQIVMHANQWPGGPGAALKTVVSGATATSTQQMYGNIGDATKPTVLVKSGVTLTDNVIGIYENATALDAGATVQAGLHGVAGAGFGQLLINTDAGIGDQISLEIANGPGGATFTINPTGVMRWAPAGAGADTTWQRAAVGVLEIPQLGGGIRLHSPGATIRTISLADDGSLVLS